MNSKRFFAVIAAYLLIIMCAVVCVPPDASAANLHDRAKNLYDVGDYRAALNLYERMLKSDPNDGLAWELSAWCLRYLGEAKSSEENYKKALTILSGEDAVWAFIGIGELYINEKRFDDALVKLREGKAFAAGNEEATERAIRDIKIAEDALAALKLASSDDIVSSDKIANSAEEHRAKTLLDPQSQEPIAPTGDKKDKPEPPKTATPAKAPGDKKPPEPPKETQGKPAPDSPKPPAQPKPKPQQPKPARPPRPARNDVVYGVKLGSPIAEALESLKAQGCKTEGEPFAKNGKEYYAVSGLKASLPDSMTKGANSRRFYIVAFDDAVLSVNVELDYGNSPKFDELKRTALDEIGNITGRNNTRGLSEVSNIFSYEINLAVSNTYGVSILATDKGNRTSRIEVQHIDLYGLSNYWTGLKQ